MPKDVTQLVMQRYHINELEESIKRDTKKLHEMWETLRRQCDHPTIKVDRTYNSGGYDYKSSVVVSHTCTICDKVVKSYDDPNHSGSYG